MASCSIGLSNINLSTFSFHRVGISCTCKFDSRRTLMVKNAPSNASWKGLRRSEKPFTVFCKPPNSGTIATVDIIVHNGLPESVSSGSRSNSRLVPSRSEVESLVADICDTTSVAEFELKLDGFRLYVSREVTKEQAVPPPPLSPTPEPFYAESKSISANVNGSVSSTSLALSKLNSSAHESTGLLNKAADEGLVILQSPRVGFFRRSRTIKGKRAPPACKEKDVVKEGQLLCYIEQLGGEIPIESDVSGEIIKLLREDGEPVGYGDALISILPSFPGIMKLQ